MLYKRMPIEIEAPEDIGYDNIQYNLSESSFTDQNLKNLGINIDDLTLFYGSHFGKAELRELIIKGTSLKADDVLITAGAAMALFIVSTSLLDQGDHAIIATTNYATNIETPRSLGADISYLELSFENGFELDIDYLKSLIKPHTKLVSLTYPHNPTGVMISENKLHEIISIVENSNAYLLIDETYRDMTFGGSLPIGASISSSVISVSSMSKSYGLPGIRIGWLQCQDKKLMETFLAAKEQICITNSVIDEEIAYQFLIKKNEYLSSIRNTISENFIILKAFMKSQSYLEWVEPQGGCVCFPRFKKNMDMDMELFHKILLEKYKTYVGKGHWFETDDRHIRIGYSWEPSYKLNEGLNRILLAAQESKKC
jgi:aspartate/methionine/tyrosine aminotransferase